MAELPPKPELEYRQRQADGIIVVELTPDSDLAYGRWLTACNMARQSIYREIHDES
jgi:hypothetical protein